MSKTLMARLAKLEAAQEQQNLGKRILIVAYYDEGESREEAKRKAVEAKERELGRKIPESELDFLVVCYVSPPPGHADQTPLPHGVIPDRTPLPARAEKPKAEDGPTRDWRMG